MVMQPSQWTYSAAFIVFLFFLSWNQMCNKKVVSFFLTFDHFFTPWHVKERHLVDVFTGLFLFLCDTKVEAHFGDGPVWFRSESDDAIVFCFHNSLFFWRRFPSFLCRKDVCAAEVGVWRWMGCMSLYELLKCLHWPPHSTQRIRLWWIDEWINGWTDGLEPRGRMHNYANSQLSGPCIQKHTLGVHTGDCSKTTTTVCSPVTLLTLFIPLTWEFFFRGSCCDADVVWSFFNRAFCFSSTAGC